jgi:hypothetical protein
MDSGDNECDAHTVRLEEKYKLSIRKNEHALRRPWTARTRSRSSLVAYGTPARIALTASARTARGRA